MKDDTRTIRSSFMEQGHVRVGYDVIAIKPTIIVVSGEDMVNALIYFPSLG